MFSTAMRRSFAPMKATRAFSAARDGVFKPKTTKDIWLGDGGAYPVMVGIGWCCFFCTAFSIYYASTSPDVRLWGKSRDQLFRGEIAGEYTKK